jgi:hypothetical protein
MAMGKDTKILLLILKMQRQLHPNHGEDQLHHLPLKGGLRISHKRMEL